MPVEEWQAKLEADPDLAAYVDLTFRHFDATGDWPDVREMQRDLVRDDKSLDVISAGNRIPGDLGIPPMRMNDHATLTIIGISLCQGSEQLRKSFIKLLQMCVATYKQPGEPLLAGMPLKPRLKSRRISFTNLSRWQVSSRSFRFPANQMTSTRFESMTTSGISPRFRHSTTT